MRYSVKAYPFGEENRTKPSREFETNNVNEAAGATVKFLNLGLTVVASDTQGEVKDVVEKVHEEPLKHEPTIPRHAPKGK